MRFKTLMECANYLNTSYGNSTFSIIVKQKKRQQGYDEMALGIIRKEYNIFFDNMNKLLELSAEDEVVQNHVKEFEILLDLFYGKGKETLGLYKDLFIKEKIYCEILNSYNEKLASFIVEAIDFYIK